MILLGTWFNAQIADEGLEPGTTTPSSCPTSTPTSTRTSWCSRRDRCSSQPTRRTGRPVARSPEWWLAEDVQRQWASLKGDVPSNLKAKPDNPMLRGLVAEAEEGDYRLVQRYWEATPPEISKAAVDELARFMLNPGQADRVLETIEQIARKHWDGQ